MKRFILTLGLALACLPVAAQSAGSPDADVQLVREWYQRFLGHDTSAGAAWWSSLLDQGQAPDTVLAQILASPEYYMRAGSTPQGFVQRLHQDLTGQVPSPAETQAWVNQLYHSDRQDVAYQMLQRYPQPWSASYSGGYSSGYPAGGWGAPATAPAYPRYYHHDYDHDYRRPYYRYRYYR